MSTQDPSSLPADRAHLDPEERDLLGRFETLVGRQEYEEAHNVLEDLWWVAVDVHKPLYQGLANALAAVCARRLGHMRGAREIAAQSRTILAPFPRQVLGFDLDVLLDSADRFVEEGRGKLDLRTEG